MVGRVGAPAQRPVAHEHRDVRNARRAQGRLRAFSQRAHPLDGKDLLREGREQRGLISRPRADFENAFLAAEAEGLEVSGLCERLRDRLPNADREGGVFIGTMAHRFGYEEVARRRREGSEHGKITDALRAQLLNESRAVAAVGVTAASHLPRSHCRTTSRSL